MSHASEGPSGSAQHAHAHHDAPGTAPTAPGHAAAPGSRPHGGSGWAAGGSMFAGVLMMVLGILDMLQGIVGIARDDVYGVIGDYVFEFNASAWGWIHLVIGLLVAVVGAGILSGATWAKAGGVALASLAIISNFLWLPYQPVWAIISIAIAVFVIWSLCTDDTPRGAGRVA
ncbi:hypothetical protein [Streptomyces sp. ODS05-4]|uniref:DUF7144 family membrane protein n=1 Tax=Streptomyces sp. ODS05-4 TaxID=2944939 RepID=UPI00210DE247|nr:hypothetical protein [Streptomyces sp. ODS05-4]